MTAEEFDRKMDQAAFHLVEEMKRIKSEFEAQIEKIFEEAEGDDIPEHLMMASVNAAMKKVTDAQAEFSQNE